MKIAFCTCVQLGLGCLEHLSENGINVDLGICLEDDMAQAKSGRIYLDDFCHRNAVPLLKIRHVNDLPDSEEFKQYEIDCMLLIGWSQIANQKVLECFDEGLIGAHPTLLPKGRGRASIPWAIIKGLNETGVTFFRIDEGVDTGDIVAQERIPIDQVETATSLYSKVELAHRTLCVQVVNALKAGSLEAKAQDETQATIWPGRTPDDGVLTTDMSVVEVDRLVRATTSPYPGAFIDLSGKRYTIWTGVIGKQATLNAMPIKFADDWYTATRWQEID